MSTPAHTFLQPNCLKEFIRKSDNKKVQAKYSVWENGNVWIIERDENNAVIRSDIYTEDEFNELYRPYCKMFE